MSSLYPWQHTQWQQVMNTYAAGSLHALLLYGQQGMGQVDFARRLAAWMLCEQARDQGLAMACGHCSACHLLEGQTHPDLIELSPEDKSQFIVVDQVRTLVDTVSRTSMRDGYQVVLIQPADCLNIAAANALLKTLEEPAGRVFFILATSQPSKLPATILSRCQAIRFDATEDECKLAWLQQHLPAEVDAQQMLRLANNAPLLAVELVEQGYLQIFNQVLQCFLDIFTNKIDPVSASALLIKHEARWVVKACFTVVADMIRVKMKIEDDGLTFSSQSNQLGALLQEISLVSLFNFYDVITQSFSLWLGRIKVNESLMLDAVFLQWRQLARS